MMQMKNNGIARLSILLAVIAASLLATGCSTAPTQRNQATVVADSRSATQWFRNNVRGLSAQLDNSAGYISYPGVGRYGLLIGGGKFGRGVVYDSNHRQVGWAYINMVSAGLQVGVQGYKMLVVFEDAATMRRFQQNKLTGNVGVTIVAARAGGAGTASFTDGVAIYEGDQVGLMAGVSVGLEYMRFEAVGQ